MDDGQRAAWVLAWSLGSLGTSSFSQQDSTPGSDREGRGSRDRLSHSEKRDPLLLGGRIVATLAA